MNRLRRHLVALLARMQRRRAKLPRLSRAAGLALAAALLIGGLWLWRVSNRPQRAAIAPGTPAAALGPLAAELSSRGIDARLHEGRLTVPAEQLPEARELLARQSASQSEQVLEDLRRLVEQQDLWSTRRQREQRWNAARMLALSRLVSGFAAIENANVLFEPGEPARLGRAAVRPAAVVVVELAPRAPMTASTVEAVADLVAGNIAGMAAADVRVVDRRGTSYRVPYRGSVPADASLPALESYLALRVREALAGTAPAGMKIAVRAASDESGERAVAVRLSLSEPASSDAATADGQEYRHLAAAALDLAGPDAVELALLPPSTVPDEEAAVTAVPAEGPSSSAETTFGDLAEMLAARRWHLAAAAAGAVALVGATWAWRSRRRRRAAGADAGPPLREDRRERALSLLKLISADDLLGLLRTEHPQTVAVILSQLPIERAAAVLSGLDPARQAEVSRRVARLETVDEQLLAEIGEELTERLEELLAAGDGPAGGSERLAELLHHAGRTTERNVIGRLEDREPDLADSLRGRLLRFEDLERVSAWQLRAALERTDSGELALALRVAGREAVRKVLASLPAPRARQLRCEIQRLGPVRLCDVETAQQRLLEAVRSVEDGTYCPAPDPAGQDREPRGTARPWHA